MLRQVALVIVLILFVVFVFLMYYGAQSTLWSSIIFSIFVSLIILNLFYPVSQLTTDPGDFTLIFYSVFVIVGIILLSIYIMHKTLSDVRIDYHNDMCD